MLWSSHKPRTITWIPVLTLAIGAGLLGGGCGLVLLAGPSRESAGLFVVGIAGLVIALFDVRVLSRPTPDEIQVRKITGARRRPAEGASLRASMHGAGHVHLEAVTPSESIVLITWLSPVSLRGTVRLCERIGQSLELPLQVDPQITDSLSFHRRAWRTAGLLFAVFLAIVVAVAVGLQVFWARGGNP